MIFRGMYKNFEYLWVSFFIYFKVASKKCIRFPCFTLLSGQEVRELTDRCIYDLKVTGLQAVLPDNQASNVSLYLLKK